MPGVMVWVREYELGRGPILGCEVTFELQLAIGENMTAWMFVH
jgi:hypothetical protein